MAFPVNGVNPANQTTKQEGAERGKFQEALNGAKGAGQSAALNKSRQGEVQEQVPVSRSRSGEGEIRDMETSVVHNILADGALDEILSSNLGEELENSPLGEYLSDLLEAKIQEYSA